MEQRAQPEGSHQKASAAAGNKQKAPQLQRPAQEQEDQNLHQANEHHTDRGQLVQGGFPPGVPRNRAASRISTLARAAQAGNSGRYSAGSLPVPAPKDGSKVSRNEGTPNEEATDQGNLRRQQRIRDGRKQQDHRHQEGKDILHAKQGGRTLDIIDHPPSLPDNLRHHGENPNPAAPAGPPGRQLHCRRPWQCCSSPPPSAPAHR